MFSCDVDNNEIVGEFMNKTLLFYRNQRKNNALRARSSYILQIKFQPHTEIWSIVASPQNLCTAELYHDFSTRSIAYACHEP